MSANAQTQFGSQSQTGFQPPTVIMSPNFHPEQRGITRRQNNSYKRLIVCCDGTGQQTDTPLEVKETDARHAWDYGDWVPSSNVTRFCRAIADAKILDDGHEIPQVVFYQNGVATGVVPDPVKLQYGITGEGLNENVCEAYLWLSNNWVDGDEIFLFGFSRGAYTARAIAGLISHIGFIGKTATGAFHKVYDAYQKRTQQWAGKDHIQGGFRSTTPIKLVGVWDTVGSLGDPVRSSDRDFAFHETTITDNIENAFHCLALDEHRGSFTPTLWFLPDTPSTTNLKQCWFSGVHSDVGGSYEDTIQGDSSDISFAWMMDQCRGLLEFNELDVTARTVRPTLDNHEPEQRSLWAAQPIHNSMVKEFKLGRSIYRCPGEYVHVDAWTGGPAPVGPTRELIHPSVRMRMLKSKDWGIKDWQPVAMNGFHLAPGEKEGSWKWVKVVKESGGEKHIEIPEYEIEGGSMESKMLTEKDKEMLADIGMSNKLQAVNGQKSWFHDHIW